MEKRTLKATTGFNVIRIPKKVTRLKMRMYGTCRGYRYENALIDGHYDFTYDITTKNDPVLVRLFTYNHYQDEGNNVNTNCICISDLWEDESGLHIPLIANAIIDYEYYVLKGGVVVKDSEGVKRQEYTNYNRGPVAFLQSLRSFENNAIVDLGHRGKNSFLYDERMPIDDYYRFVRSGTIVNGLDLLQPYTVTMDIDLIDYEELEE